MSTAHFRSVYEKELFDTRYQNGDELGWDDLFGRVSSTVASGEEAKTYKEAMSSGLMMPSSPQLWNYGSSRRFSRNGSSCFTGEMGDTLDDFRKADADAEAVYVASGGFGLLLNRTRPRGTKIKHCSEGAMGSMCFGGPARRIEGTTGYITGSGRARGALMLQMSMWHPDILEFITAKQPQSLGWLDDWHANASAVAQSAMYSASIKQLINEFSVKHVFVKEWPQAESFDPVVIAEAKLLGIIEVDGLGRVVPMVTDWSNMKRRPANRDWNLPMQNCNMSVRVSDAFMNAVANKLPYPLRWFSSEQVSSGELSWTKIDIDGSLTEVTDGRAFSVDDDGKVSSGETPYKYGVVLTTWEGLKANLSPNKNHWRDTDYARLYRKTLEPIFERFSGPIMAYQLWDLVIENAHSHADPGVVFEDTYERFQPIDSKIYGPRLSNPCSEYVNSAGGSCNLVSVNLRKVADKIVVDSNAPARYSISDWHTIQKSAQFKTFLVEVGQAAATAICYINSALNWNVAPVKYIDEMTRHHFRTVGVGIMGLAEALMKFHIVYGSTCAQNFAAAVMSEVGLTCWETSFELARTNPELYPKPLAWDSKRMSAIFHQRAKYADKTHDLEYRRHTDRWINLAAMSASGQHATNTCVTSVAPTGTISMIASWCMTEDAASDKILTVTSGIEPPFEWGVARQDSSGSDEQFHDLWWTEEHRQQPWMRTSMEVTSNEHVLMQAAVCHFTDMSVSKTINVPESATKGDVEQAYYQAWSLGVPGTSLYRDKSKPMQVLSALECPSGECKVDFTKLASK